MVKPEDRKVIEDSFYENVNQWRKRKRMFKEIWDTITENSPKDQKEFKVASVFSSEFCCLFRLILLGPNCFNCMAWLEVY